MSSQLTKLDFLDNQATIFKESRSRLEKNSKEIQNIVETNTKNEVKEVHNAIDNLNKKLDQIMNTDTIKQKQNSMIEDQKKMALSVDIAAKTFFKIRNLIYQKNLTREERLGYEKKVYDKIISKFLTEEDIRKFEQIIKMGPIMMLGSRGKPNMLM